MFLKDWPREDGLGGTGGVAGLFGTEAVGTKVRVVFPWIQVVQEPDLSLVIGFWRF